MFTTNRCPLLTLCKHIRTINTKRLIKRRCRQISVLLFALVINFSTTGACILLRTLQRRRKIRSSTLNGEDVRTLFAKTRFIPKGAWCILEGFVAEALEKFELNLDSQNSTPEIHLWEWTNNQGSTHGRRDMSARPTCKLKNEMFGIDKFTVTVDKLKIQLNSKS